MNISQRIFQIGTKMKKKKRESRRPDPRGLLRKIAGPMLEIGMMGDTDVERFAQRMTAARTAKERGEVVNEWIGITIRHLRAATRRMMSTHAAQHPGPN
jgi:hypothetical protein